MKQIYLPFYFLFLLCSITVWGQTSQVTSLQTQLQNAEGKNRISILNQLSSELRFSEPKQAAKYATEAYKLAKKIQDNSGLIQSAYFLAIYERDRKNLNKAVNYAEEGLSISKQASDQFTGLELLVQIHRLSGKDKKIKEAENALERLKVDQALVKKNQQYQQLRKSYASSERDLLTLEGENMEMQTVLDSTLENILRKEAELARVAKEKAELEAEANRLYAESLSAKVQVQAKEIDLFTKKARIQRQRTTLISLIVGLLVISLIAFLLIRNYQLKKKQAEEKAVLQEKLLVQEKMATLGQLTAGIAHEIKNPLNFVNNFAEGSTQLVDEMEEHLGSEKHNMPAAFKEELEELVQEFRQNSAYILQHGKRADRIVNSMMEHTRGDVGQLQAMNINQLIEDNLALAYHGFRSTHPNFTATFSRELDDSLPSIQGYPQDLSRVLINLFQNACYAIQQKLEEKEEGYQPEIRVRTKQEKNEILIEVSDNGPGIPKDLERKVFEPFYTTKPTGEGHSGLGLSISYDIIVERHKGSFQLDSNTKEGASFHIRLPKN